MNCAYWWLVGTARVHPSGEQGTPRDGREHNPQFLDTRIGILFESAASPVSSVAGSLAAAFGASFQLVVRKSSYLES
jgi:hypothetical protein